MGRRAELPAAMSHGVVGSGAQALLFGTAFTESGGLVITHGWPLSRVSDGSGPGMAHGQGVVSFGGTWWVISPAGPPIIGASSASSRTGVSGHGC